MKHLTVLIGDSEEIIIELVTELMQDVVGVRYVLKVLSTHNADELLAIAETNPIDFFVLYLNNILFPSGSLPAEDRLQLVMGLISDFKTKYRKPIVAISGLPEYRQPAKEAGVDRFFDAPFRLEEFKSAVKDCLHHQVADS